MRLDSRTSSNIEVDCLGKRTNIDSKDANGAFACQQEVNKLRESTVASILREGLQDKSISFKDDQEKIEGYAESANLAFDKFQLNFADSQSSITTKFANFFKGVSDDNFESRELNFEHELHDRLNGK
jgi:hypothetical protein